MLNFFIIAGAFLLLLILFLVFRITSLVGIVKGSHKKIASGSNKVNAALMILFLIIGFGAMFWYSYTRFDLYNLPVASEHGVITDRLFWITMAVTGLVFVITHILLFLFPYIYQYSEKRSALFYPDNTKLEIIWTLVPAVVLTILVGMGWSAWSDITSEAPEDAEVVEVMGFQFGWACRYPGIKDNKLAEYDWRKIDAVNSFGMDLADKNAYDDFMPAEIHIPKGKTVLFKIRAKDVLHSVFVPHMRVKMDAVPGMPTHFKFLATKSTKDMQNELNDPDFEYALLCTEVCGKGHFSMKYKIVVDEPADYEKWKASQEPWLKMNPEYLDQVPANLREYAKIKSGMDSQFNNVAVEDKKELNEEREI